MVEEFLALLRPTEIAYRLLAGTAFLWAPILLGGICWTLWLRTKRMMYIKKTFKWVLLEVRLPKEIVKTPVAMELVLGAMFQSSAGTWFEQYWNGRVKPWFSLELVSLEGAVKFLIRTPAKFRKVIESALYAQYPNIEVVEIPDYVFSVPYTKESKDWDAWGVEYMLSKPDPYPIKTYVDYRLHDTLTKEEMKSDPLSSIIELFGSIGPGQNVWLQIMIQTSSDRFSDPAKLFGKRDWKDEGKDLVKKLKGAVGEGEKLTKRQEEIITAIERSMGKLGFDVGIRSMYLAKKEVFDGSVCGGLYLLFRNFDSVDLNGIKGTNTTDFDYPWQDFRKIRLKKKKWEMFNAYIRRAYFHPPYKRRPYVFNVEELATIYHYPGGVSATPTFARIESRKAEPPSNLPV